MSGGATWLQHNFRSTPPGSGLLPPSQDGNDPPYVVTVRSSMNPLPAVTLDVDARAVGPLRGSTVRAYRELDGRVAWQVTQAIGLSLSGTNLLHDRHQEYPGGDSISRRIMGGVELRY